MSTNQLPQFSNIDVANFPEQLDALLKNNLKQIDALVDAPEPHTWDTLMGSLDDMDDRLEKLWSPFAHLHAVVNSKALRISYQACLPKLSAYESAMGHNQKLYQAIKRLDKSKLNQTRQKILDDTLLDFKLSGVALPDKQKTRFERIQARLSDLSNQYENNVLDAGQAYQYQVREESKLSGLPAHTIHTAKQLAQEKKLDGWLFNLEFPCFLAVITYADNRKLREEMYHAFATRASDQGPHAGKFDNTDIMNEILALRDEKAKLLGFKQFASLSLATKMARSESEVIRFLSDLNQCTHQQAQAEFAQLKKFVQENHNIKQLEPWDIAYYSEKLKQNLHQVSQEELRPYFTLPKVMKGLFEIIRRLYGMTLHALENVDVWHSDVTCYEIRDAQNQSRGFIYVDLFARPHKRGGAWMDSCQSRRKCSNGTIQSPIATLTCNFAKTANSHAPTLSHDEVLTLFHECGHCLHHVLTQVDELSASGISGVEWDAVELPSQFFENWCWEEEAIELLTAHVDTHKPMPNELFHKLIKAKNFQSAMAMVRQLEFSLFDFRLHQAYQNNNPDFIAQTLHDVRKQVSVVPIASFNRFQHSFSHIFGGGYAAGYYSYKWAEVLSSDAYERFEEEGIFNPKTGQDFLHEILEVGGSRTAEQSFQAFRGRPARIDALLKQLDIHTK